jgi:hypothetical protein
LTGLTSEGAAFIEAPGPLLGLKRDEVVEALSDLAHEAIESTNHFIESRADEAADSGEPFDPKVVF